MQGLHDGLGRVLAHKIAGPDVEYKALEGRGVIQGRGLLDQILPVDGQHGHRLELALVDQAHLTLAVRRHEDINQAAHHVLEGRCSAFVGHMGHGNAGDLGHVLAQQVVKRAGAYAGIGQGFAGRGRLTRIGEQLLAVARRQVFAGKHGHGVDGDHLHQAEVFGLVLQGRVGHRRQDQLVGRALENHVAVRGAGQQLLRCDAAAGATQVFHQNRLAQLLGQGVVEGAGNDVRQTASRVRHHQRDRFAGEGLGQGQAGTGRADQGQDTAAKQGTRGS